MFFWISAVTVGLGMVVVESNLTARSLKHGLPQTLLAKLSRANAYLLPDYVLAKLLDLIARGRLGLMFVSNLQAVLFSCELGLGALIPAVLMAQPKVRANKDALFATAGLVVAGGILNRLTSVLSVY